MLMECTVGKNEKDGIINKRFSGKARVLGRVASQQILGGGAREQSFI
jgi:hypothetical protein